MPDDTILDYYYSLQPLQLYSLEKILLLQDALPESLAIAMELVGEGLVETVVRFGNNYQEDSRSCASSFLKNKVSPFHHRIHSFDRADCRGK